MTELLPVFLNLAGRMVVLVGGGPVAEAKLRQFLAAGARVRVVAPAIAAGIRAAGVEIVERDFAPPDLEGAGHASAGAPTRSGQASESPPP